MLYVMTEIGDRDVTFREYKPKHRMSEHAHAVDMPRDVWDAFGQPEFVDMR